METGVRARGLAGRVRAWRWCLRALGHDSQGAGRLHTNDGAQRAGLGPAPTDASEDDARRRALRNSNRLYRN